MKLDFQRFYSQKKRFRSERISCIRWGKICLYLFKCPFPVEIQKTEGKQNVNLKLPFFRLEYGLRIFAHTENIIDDLAAKVDYIYIKGQEKAKYEYLRSLSSRPIILFEKMYLSYKRRRIYAFII